MKKLLFAAIAGAMFSTCLLAAEINVGGNWEMTMDSPHGKLTGPLILQQDGAKITGTYEVQPAGKLTLSGSVDGDKIRFTMDVPAGPMTINFEGTSDGDKLSGTTSPLKGEWSAVHK